MKQLLLFMVLLTKLSNGQSNSEAKIKQLEQQESSAIQKGDTTTLLHIWASKYVVNNPYGQIVTVRQIINLIRSGKIDYTSMKRIVDKVTFIDNIAVSMGHEIVTPENKTSFAGKTITRRYTNIWMKRKGSWLLVARHASISNTQ